MPLETLATLMRIAEAVSTAEVWEAATRYFAGLGFSHVNYGYTRFRSAKSLGDPDDALFLTTADAGYAQRYFRNGFYSKTPAYRWAQTHDGAITWTWVREALLAGQLSAEEAETVQQNIAAGIIAGITISFPASSSRSKGAMGLIADPGLDHVAVDNIFAQRGTDLLAVAHMMHMKIIQFPMTGRKCTLTARQREVLEWVADGKATLDIALLMDVSPAMVEKHLRLARAALDVSTTAQAVAKASLMNLIFPLQPRPYTQESSTPQAIAQDLGIAAR